MKFEQADTHTIQCIKAVGPGKNSKINKRRAYALIPNYRVFKIDRAKMCIPYSFYSCLLFAWFWFQYNET